LVSGVTALRLGDEAGRHLVHETSDSTVRILALGSSLSWTDHAGQPAEEVLLRMREHTMSITRDFSLNVGTHDGIGVLWLAGELDGSCAWQVHRSLGEMTSGAIVIDLSELDAIDVSGLAVIVEAKRACDDSGQFLTVRSAHGSVRRMFQAHKLDDLLVEERAIVALSNMFLAAQAAEPASDRCQQAPEGRGSWVPGTICAKAATGPGAPRLRARCHR